MAGWALSTVVSEAFLNAIAAEGVGDGVEVAGFRQAFNLPMLGALDLGVDLRIVDGAGQALPPGAPGEICLRGVSVMQGYWDDPVATGKALRGGWFHTGDVGYVTAEGLLFVVDRIKDVINRAGEKIAAAEVESCLLQRPELSEAAVFAMPDEDTGEAVAAAVVLREGCRRDEAELAAELRAHVAAHLAAYKVPARIFVRHAALPRNPAGKLLKVDLKREYLTR